MTQPTMQACVKIRHPVTGRFIGNFYPATGVLEVVDRGKLGTVKLPATEDRPR